MGFRSEAYAKIWEVQNKGNYSLVDMSISKKNKTTGEYETDFKNKFVRFIGTAHKDADKLQKGSTIKIGNCDVTSLYNKEKNDTYTNFLVFSFEIPDGNGSNNNSKPTPSQAKNDGFMNIPDGIDEELPFN